MADTLSVSGLSEVLANLDKSSAYLMVGVQEAFASALQLIYDESQANCPVDTGALKASGTVEIGELQGSVSYGNDQVDYAIYVEMGHHTRSGSFVPAQPYLFPAYIDGVAQLKQDLGLTGI